MPSPADMDRKARLINAFRGRSLEAASADPEIRRDMEAEARSADPDKLVTPDLLEIADAARKARGAAPSLSLFFSSADVILVPGFLASQLEDAAGGRLIWISPRLVLDASPLSNLSLAADDTDGVPGVSIIPDGALPVIYAGLRTALEFSRYSVQEFAFDWRKHVDASAARLADLIRDRTGHRPRPLHLIPHSQGSLVARRALQLLGPDLGRRLVDSLVLLGPATAGSFSAAFGIAGTHELLDTARKYGIDPPDAFNSVLQSMTGMYQLLPWRVDSAGGTTSDKALEWVKNHPDFRTPDFWKSGVDKGRLSGHFGWAAGIDASYLNDRTTIILGDQPTTVGGVKWVPDASKPGGARLDPDHDFDTPGDGTVPDAMARISGVTRVFKASNAEHAMLAATWSVIVAVRDVLAGRTPGIEPLALGAAPTPGAALWLAKPPEPDEFFGVRRPPARAGVAAEGAEGAEGAEPATTPPAAPAPGPARIADVSPPPTRRLRVFSFDPLFGTNLDDLGADQLTVELPWEFADGSRLEPGPVGEYLEVIDFDPASGCFYPPVDLNHPHLLAQDGIPVSEGDPRFHQQMAYAVAMATIRQFEVALGRRALWAPNLRRDQFGNVITPARPGDEYVGRLRIYPHAMREENAYYQPDKKALLLGYFSADGEDVGRNLPGGTVFSCLSYDIIAHETTHALLDGLHRYFIQPSNPDVFAFHEAFADVVALFQHFSHPEVLRQQIARARGDLGRESTLGVLAVQFGEATGHRAALRQYLGRRGKDGGWEPVAPDKELIRRETEPHARGAILVAAVFRAFANIYENRVKDLRRIATGGTGLLPEGDLHPDMVNRLAGEAAKAARHLLQMCIRALDYVPPVDITFGEYLRALITADYDLVRDDDRRYRVSVVSAFRDWGIYPTGVRSLSVDSLLWNPPEEDRCAAAGAGGPNDRRFLTGLHEFFAALQVDWWALTGDRRLAYLRMGEHAAAFHDWLQDTLPADQAWRLGLSFDPAAAPGGIERRTVVRNGEPRKRPDGTPDARPVFHVHMFRPCRRIGPDGQELTDVVVELIQRRQGFFDPARQAAVDSVKGSDWTHDAWANARPDFYFRGGCTLIIDPKTGTVRYCVRKEVDGPPAERRLAAERDFRLGRSSTATAAFLDSPDDANPFAALHAGGEHEVKRSLSADRGRRAAPASETDATIKALKSVFLGPERVNYKGYIAVSPETESGSRLDSLHPGARGRLVIKISRNNTYSRFGGPIDISSGEDRSEVTFQLDVVGDVDANPRQLSVTLSPLESIERSFTFTARELDIGAGKKKDHLEYEFTVRVFQQSALIQTVTVRLPAEVFAGGQR